MSIDYIPVSRLKQKNKQAYLCLKNELQYRKGKHNEYFYSIIEKRQYMLFHTNHIVIIQKPKISANKTYSYKIFLINEVHPSIQLPLQNTPKHYRSFKNTEIKNIIFSTENDNFMINFIKQDSDNIVFRITNAKLRNLWFKMLDGLTKDPKNLHRLDFINYLQWKYLIRKCQEEHKDKKFKSFSSTISTNMKEQINQFIQQRCQNLPNLISKLLQLQKQNQEKWNQLSLLQNGKQYEDSSYQEQIRHQSQILEEALTMIYIDRQSRSFRQQQERADEEEQTYKSVFVKRNRSGEE